MAGKICSKKEDMYFGKTMSWLERLQFCMHFSVMDNYHFGLSTAIIGNGNTAHGAVRVLNMLGSKRVYANINRHTEKLLRDEIGQYDVIVNCVLWDTKRKDHIIYREDLSRMKKDAMIIDVSCDRNGGIETVFQPL